MALTVVQKAVATSIDQIVWNNAAPQATTTGELRLLRGIHNKVSLDCIKAFLQGVHVGKKINLCSVWIDKTPQAFYKKKNNQPGNTELADLLVYVRTRTPAGLTRRAILLQGKPIFKRLQSYGSAGATPKEEYLYANCPEFEVRSHGGAVGKPLALAPFDLKKVYPGATPASWAKVSGSQTHWRFLSICRSQTEYVKWAPESPFHTRWPVKGKIPGEGLTEVIADMLMPAPTLGLPVEDINGADDWKRLVNSLIAYTRSKVISWNSGAAKRKRNIRCFMVDMRAMSPSERKADFGFDPEAFESTYDSTIMGPLVLLDKFRDHRHLLVPHEDEIYILNEAVEGLPPDNSRIDGELPDGGGIHLLIVDVDARTG